MGELEARIRGFLSERGVEVVGFAGSERLNGPPSLNPRYTLRGARSIISMALAMNVEAINDFLGKKSPVPHNLDQLKQSQRLFRISHELAEYLRSLGHKAQEVPVNNSFRRTTDLIRPDPSFSHRFGAIAAGIAGQALSGNVMTERYGASVYLSTVVTNAKLESSPAFAPDHFMRTYCDNCGICVNSCATGMFTGDEEEYVLLNGDLHPRGKRRNLNFCNATCFGLHGLSRDRTWSTWGRFWIKNWADEEPDPANTMKVRKEFLFRGGTTGDTTARYDFIRRMFSMLWPREEVEDRIPEVADLPDDPEQLEQLLWDFEKGMGVDGVRGDPNTLTCGQCAPICGPTLDESRRRYQTLLDGGIVVPGPEGKMVRVKDFEEAVEYKKAYKPPVTREEMVADGIASGKMWKKLYFGYEPISKLQGWIYDRKLKRAVRAKRRRDPDRSAG